MPALSARGCGKWAASLSNGVFPPPPREAPTGFKNQSTKDRNVQDFWEVQALASTFKNELDISQEASEEDLGVCGKQRTTHQLSQGLNMETGDYSSRVCVSCSAESSFYE